jgi:LmbE family N-acetylglucosaminyl deacetylase
MYDENLLAAGHDTLVLWHHPDCGDPAIVDLADSAQIAVPVTEADATHTELSTDFSARQVLVLAPHMDDEVLGCGGTLRQHILAGAMVTAVYMTDGRKGDPEVYRQGFPPAMVAQKEQAMVLSRKTEAGAAARILGIQEQIFLAVPDSQLQPLPEVVGRVQTLLQERRPAVVYYPSVFDLHPDHWATNRILCAVTRARRFPADWSPVYRGYEVWTPLLTNCLIDISAVIKVKEAAITQFASQLRHTDFVHTILGLNAYRSLYASQGHGYAEAFYESSPELYCQLFQRLSLP